MRLRWLGNRVVENERRGGEFKGWSGGHTVTISTYEEIEHRRIITGTQY